MPVRKTSVAWLILGVILIAGAVIIKFVALPSMMKLPADLNQSQKYEGTMQALNPQAFASNDLAHLLTPEVPISADRSLKVDAVDGDTAIVTSKALLNLPDGSKRPDVHTYAVSRVDFTPVNLSRDQERSLVSANEGATFERHTGVAFSWPMNPPKDGTALYDPVTRTAQVAAFSGEGNVEGRDVYYYRVDAAGSVASPAVLAQFKSFPRQLPKAVVAGLLQADIVPASSLAALSSALPSMPDLIDIHFTSANVINLAVDREFGAPLNVDQTQSIYASIPVDGKDVPALPLSIVKLHPAGSEVASAAHTLQKNATLLSAGGTWVPIVLVVLGIIGAAVGIVRWRNPSHSQRNSMTS
ncbi:porin PorA family protein [Nocardia fusca]|uniref:porin PorA family protein n=1 Tax=Nocardia fusca TaxID=941183 RepID=UPI00378D2C49